MHKCPLFYDKLWAYLIHCLVYTFQCFSKSSHRCSAGCNTLSDPPNVRDESTLHRVHVLIPAKDSNKSLTYLFYKIVIVAETQVDESVRSIFVGLNCNYFFLHHT